LSLASCPWTTIIRTCGTASSQETT
jgi:hypothetical protein